MLKIKEMRKDKGIFQKELATALKTNIVNISNWETGRNEPSCKDLISLANYFQCSVDYLLGRENELGLVEVKGAQLTKAENIMLKTFNILNVAGQLKAVAYAEGLAENPEYRARA